MVPDRLPEGTRLTKLVSGKFRYPATIETDSKHHYLEGPFQLKDEFAAMKGAKWMGYDPNNPRKVWRVDNCRRNNFNLMYLEGINTFAQYTKKLTDDEKLLYRLPITRKDWQGTEIRPYAHQDEMTLHMLVRKQCIIAGEMGVGKTLALFRAAEVSLVPEIWYVAPKSALASVKLEAMKWRFQAKCIYMTYEELKKILQNWEPGKPPPKFVAFDESSRVKTPTSQRSQAAFYLAENMRNHWGDDCYIILMSGSPAPKSPLDWFHQCEIACPGFIREGDIHKFQRRLAVMAQQEDIVGTKFMKLLAWKDGNPNVCDICGKSKVHEDHDNGMTKNYHVFKPVANEVEKLYRRMAGLTLVKLKKDCLDLPDKIYQQRVLKPSIDLLRAARIVASKSRSAIEAMTLLRELSDGFQYQDDISGEICTACDGKKTRFNDKGETEPCLICNATGNKNKIERKIIEVSSPKLEQLSEDLDYFEDGGRLVIYAGFTGSIDRVCNHVKKCGWEFIRVDGRGWYNSINPGWDALECLKQFQNTQSGQDKLVFVGHPGSAGMGITLTASPAIIYFSNDFNAESRIQSEDRIHRAGMDVSRGATIIDYLLLPTDRKVLENLKRKRELQSISIGELQHAIDNFSFTTDGTL